MCSLSPDPIHSIQQAAVFNGELYLAKPELNTPPATNTTAPRRPGATPPVAAPPPPPPPPDFSDPDGWKRRRAAPAPKPRPGVGALEAPPAAAAPAPQPSVYWARVQAEGDLCAPAAAEAQSSGNNSSSSNSSSAADDDVAVVARGVISASEPAGAPLALGVPALAVDFGGRVHLAYACGSPGVAAAGGRPPRGGGGAAAAPPPAAFAVAPSFAGVCVSVADAAESSAGSSPASAAAAPATPLPPPRVVRVMEGEAAVEDAYKEGSVAWGVYSAAQHFDGELWFAVPASRAPADDPNAWGQPAVWLGTFDATAAAETGVKLAAAATDAGAAKAKAGDALPTPTERF